jgi:hypothetical protein
MRDRRPETKGDRRGVLIRVPPVPAPEHFERWRVEGVVAAALAVLAISLFLWPGAPLAVYGLVVLLAASLLACQALIDTGWIQRFEKRWFRWLARAGVLMAIVLLGLCRFAGRGPPETPPSAASSAPGVPITQGTSDSPALPSALLTAEEESYLRGRYELGFVVIPGALPAGFTLTGQENALPAALAPRGYGDEGREIGGDPWSSEVYTGPDPRIVIRTGAVSFVSSRSQLEMVENLLLIVRAAPHATQVSKAGGADYVFLECLEADGAAFRVVVGFSSSLSKR